MHETPAQVVAEAAALRERVSTIGCGFLKTTLDPDIHARLLRHFTDNVQKFKSETANKYLQTESTRSRPSLIFFDEDFNQGMLRDMKRAHEEWCGVPLKHAACYGIRAYQPGSYLHNHLDHVQTHVVSSTICVDHQLDGYWPLYIEDLDDNPHEVIIEPGEMVFYEGARLRHGRPYALPGEYYANIFLHYTPLDWKVKDAQPATGR